ncbi:ABC transporter permease [Microterricola pindariensis]|uniref:ABC transporter permease n=1 Tax=Microterricola pindariensis TaxID=478010 RepID=A0ABX5ARV5_9MICO|nr:ABC transporter permease [Microterricola pindariensis]PPL14317.1 hypothetical protein GY24_16615 [Microterricola pindariensis]
MSTATLSQTTARSTVDGTLRFGGVIRSEWIKLRSLRSTVWSYLLVFAISLGMALVMSTSMTDYIDQAASGSADEQRGMLLMASTFGVFFGQLVVAVLGVLVISGEYTTGMIRSTLTAVPRRLPALAAKAIVLFVSTFVVGLLGSLGAFLIASAVFASHGVTASLAEPEVFLPLLGGALYLALISLFALGLGTILRNSAGGIAAALGILLLLPTVLQMIPAEWASDLIPSLLSVAGMGLFDPSVGVGEPDALLKNLLIVLAWVAAAVVGAALSLKRRDA